MIRALLVLIVILYALQLFSPLRLNGDATALLTIAESGAAGTGFLLDGQKTQFPPGYPAAVAVLLRAHVFGSATLMGLTFLCLGAGVLATYYLVRQDICEEHGFATAISFMTLLSYVVVKHATIPLSDIPYFGVAMAGLAMLSRAAQVRERRGWLTASAWAIILVSICVRRVGVVLLPALLYVGWLGWREARFRGKVQWLLALGFMAPVTAWTIRNTSTLSDFSSIYREKGLANLSVELPRYRLTELGELLTNIPASKLPAAMAPVLIVAGIAAACLVAWGIALVLSTKGLRPAHVYVAGYVLTVAIWPAINSRFWLPVVPLLFAYGGVALKRAWAAGAVPYFCAFAIMGLFALGYSTRISLAGSEFPLRYGNETVRPSYCAAYGSCPVEGPVDPRVVHLIAKSR